MAAPSDDSEPVACGRRHTTRTLAVGTLPGPSREEPGLPLEWRYGRQPPARDAWATGVRHGLCWVPAG